MTGDNTLLIWDIAIQLEESRKTCRRSAVCPPLQYWFVSTGDRYFALTQTAISVAIKNPRFRTYLLLNRLLYNNAMLTS